MSGSASCGYDDPVVEGIRRLIARELREPVPERVRRLADQARSAYGDAILAVLYYGSCLRDGWSPRALADLYLLGSDYRRLHDGWLARLLNRLLPPNVYYVEAEHGGERLRAKYALLTLGQFEAKLAPEVRNPYFWGRFAQPVGLAWVCGPEVRQRLEWALARAVVSFYRAVRPLLPPGCDARRFWIEGFRATYSTELRVEKPERAVQLFERFRHRYELLYDMLERSCGRIALKAGDWRWRRLEGKLLSAARLAKAAFTFEGGADYLAWKIHRHSGRELALTPFQRRHPLLAALPLVLRLKRERAIR